MVLISHRGNINGKSGRENHPDYIDEAIEAGYDVEIDVWVGEINTIWLGHDKPEFPIDIQWLEKRSTSLWIHCKNMKALSYFNKYSDTTSKQFNYFSHDTDVGVLTSHNYIWSTNVYDRGILVLPEVFDKEPIETTIGICSDVIENYK